MKKKFFPLLLIAFTIIISIFVMILPTFFSKNLAYIELKQELKLDLVLSHKEDIELIFFGYTGCLEICTPRIEALKQWYSTLSFEQQERVTLTFFDLSVPKDPTAPDIFVKAFHPKFRGVYLSDKILRKYTKTFNVYFASSLFSKEKIDHSTHLYLAKRTGIKKELRAIYTAYPYNFKLLTTKIEGLLNE